MMTFSVYYGFKVGRGYTDHEAREGRRLAAMAIERLAGTGTFGPDFKSLEVKLCEVLGDPIEFHVWFNRDPGSEAARREQQDRTVRKILDLITETTPEAPKSAIIRPIQRFMPPASANRPYHMMAERAEEAIIDFASRRVLGAAFMNVESRVEMVNGSGDVLFQFSNYDAEDNARGVDYLAAIIVDYIGQRVL